MSLILKILNIVTYTILNNLKNFFINLKNLYHLFRAASRKKNSKENNIIFVVQRLQNIGGIETRLNYYCDLLTRDGFNAIIITKSNDNKSLRKFINVNLDLGGSNFSFCLHAMIKLFNVNHLEFQTVPDTAMRSINFNSLREKCLVGYVIHGNYINVNYLNANNFHYIITVSDLLRNFYSKLIAMEMKVIPNAVPIDIKTCYKYSQQKNALIVTRICEEKLPTIISFIDFCNKHSIPYKIAGTETDSSRVTEHIKNLYSLADETFVGHIDTTKYLAQNMNKFLFVAGVGQVILEAGIMGFPVLICSHVSAEFSCFVNIENIKALQSENFTIKKTAGFEKFYKTQDQDYLDIRDGKHDRFMLSEYIQNNLSIEAVYKDYRDFLKTLK